MGTAPDRRGHGRWGAALALLLVAPVARAQELTPLPAFSLERLELNPGLGPMTLGNGELIPQQTLRIALWGHYQRDPLSLLSEDEQLSFIRHRTTALLSLAYGVLPWLEVDAQVSAVADQRSEDLSELGLRAPSQRGLSMPWLGARLGLLTPTARSALHLALELGVGLPMGVEGALARNPGVSASGRILLGTRFGLLAPALEAGVLLRRTVRIGTSLGTLERVGGEARVGAGLTVGRALRGEVAVHAAFSWEKSRTSAEVMGGLRYSPSVLVELFALGGLGLGAEPGTPLLRALAGLAFHIGAEAPPAPEEVFYEIVTPLPRRSSSQAPQAVRPPVTIPQRSVEELSSPEPAETEPSPSEDARSAAEQEPDADGDGVVDAVDACAQERGTVEQNGCPAGQPPLVTLTREQLILHGQVFFDTGVSTLPSSSPLLDRLAQVLLEHPEIQRVVIEGHTDTVGSEASNRTLSLERAETVRRYLIAKGVASRRLVAQGFGPRRPASTNTTEGGREQNRRAELRLLLGEPAPTDVIQEPAP